MEGAALAEWIEADAAGDHGTVGPLRRAVRTIAHAVERVGAHHRFLGPGRDAGGRGQRVGDAFARGGEVACAGVEAPARAEAADGGVVAIVHRPRDLGVLLHVQGYDVFLPIAEALAVLAGTRAAAREKRDFAVGLGGGEDRVYVDVVEPIVALWSNESGIREYERRQTKS